MASLSGCSLLSCFSSHSFVLAKNDVHSFPRFSDLEDLTSIAEAQLARPPTHTSSLGF